MSRPKGQRAWQRWRKPQADRPRSRTRTVEHLAAIAGLRILLVDPETSRLSRADACLDDAVAATIGLPELASQSHGLSGSAIRERLEGRLRELEEHLFLRPTTSYATPQRWLGSSG